MKKFVIFLGLSLAANAAFLVTFFFRPAPAGAPSAMIASATPGAIKALGGANSVTFAALASNDLAQLKAAGVPDDIARDLVVGRASLRFQARVRAQRSANDSRTPYWRNPAGPNNQFALNKTQRAENRQAQREYAETMRAVTGDDNIYGGRDTRFNFLSSAKQDQLRKITDDYGDMQNEIYGDMNGVQLASDGEKLKLLRQEQERDIAAALTPEEMEQYKLRTSNSAGAVRGRFGDGIQTEDDYKKVFALQKNFDDQFSQPENYANGAPGQDFMMARMAAEKKLVDDVHAAVGDENFAAIQQANDQEAKMLNAIVTRLNLPRDTVDTINVTRDSYATLSQQINADPSLSPADRTAQLKSLADRANADLQTALGAEGAAAYAQRANWLGTLKSGIAFSIGTKDAPKNFTTLGGSNVFPVPPPRPPKS